MRVGAEAMEPRRPRVGPAVTLALAWIGGIAVGTLFPARDAWLVVALLALLVALTLLWRRRPGLLPGALMLAVIALSAGWSASHVGFLPADHVAAYLGDEPQLARVRGSVTTRLLLRTAQDGAFAQFSYEVPRTTCELQLTQIYVDGHWRPCSGGLLLRIAEADLVLRRGDAIEAHGWLSRFEPPANPGGRDVRQMFARQGIAARLSLPSAGNRRILADGDGWSLALLRRRLSEAAAASLRLGLDDDPRRVHLLERLALGRTDAELGDLPETFRRLGLAHLLSISGAHLMMLLLLVWGLVRAARLGPRASAWVELAVLAAFLLVTPARVPIVRAGIMAGLFAFGRATGRRMAAIETLGLATLLVLIWRPGDLFDAGFQLSYGVVAALILFTRPMSRMVLPGPWDEGARDRGRRIADIMAVNLVAFLVAAPLVAYHFQMITPLAPLLSLPALPIVTVMLGLSYAKMAVGLLWPTAGQWLAAPLGWLTDGTIAMAHEAARWPGVAWDLVRSPSPLWVVAALLVVGAILSGRLKRRRRAAACAAGLCVGWLALAATPLDVNLGWDAPPPLRLHMLAVGDGSCFLLDLQPQRGRRQVVMFDCGSQQYWSAGSGSIAPALGSLGVRSIDTLILSHADADHFNAALDLADAVAIGRVLVQPHLLAEAQAHPEAAAAFLLEGLRVRGISVEVVQQGWRQMIGDVTLDMLWPPPGWSATRSNDTSLVLSVNAAGRRILLCGDIQQNAIEALLASGVDLAADVCDLPHHGSYIDASPRFLEAVRPTIVLQSSGPARLREDAWPTLLQRLDVQRFVTAVHGMVSLQIRPDGAMQVQTFRQVEDRSAQ